LKERNITLRINGEVHLFNHVPVRKTLVQLLRDDAGLIGTKEGCGEGDCGACTVLLEGEPVNSCLVLAAEADGKEVLTVEGLSREWELHPLQQAFIEDGAVQCGYCIPGMLLAAKALLDENPSPTKAEIRSAIAGNLCRCTGYVRIVQAIQSAVVSMSRPG
jgi:aerobic-type carbon monoxide dehydrogenase small subunit (CoxS/CutS family)